MVIVVLYALSIPWYRTPGAVPHVIFGLPDWVVVAVGCYLAVAVLTALTWLRLPFHDGDVDS